MRGPCPAKNKKTSGAARVCAEGPTCLLPYQYTTDSRLSARGNLDFTEGKPFVHRRAAKNICNALANVDNIEYNNSAS